MKLLVQAFKQLPSLRTLMIVDHARLLPEGFQWHGLNTFRRKTGYHNISTCPPPDDLYGGFSQEAIETYYEWLAHVFSTMIRSVAESGITTLTKIGTKSVSRSSQYALSPLDMNFSNATITKLTNGLSNLEEMKLQLRTLSLEQGKCYPSQVSSQSTDRRQHLPGISLVPSAEWPTSHKRATKSRSSISRSMAAQLRVTFVPRYWRACS